MNTATAFVADSIALPQPAPVALAAQPAMNGGFLSEFFRDLDDRKITVLTDRLTGLSLEERDKAIRAYTDANKIPSQKKEGKTVIDPVASVRASEVKAIWAGINVAQISTSELAASGYHRAVALSRQALNDKGLDSDGEVKRSRDEKQAAKLEKAGAAAMAEALMKGLQHGDDPDEDPAVKLERLAKIAHDAKVAEQAEADKARADSIIKRLLEKENHAVLTMVRTGLESFLNGK